MKFEERKPLPSEANANDKNIAYATKNILNTANHEDSSEQETGGKFEIPESLYQFFDDETKAKYDLLQNESFNNENAQNVIKKIKEIIRQFQTEYDVEDSRMNLKEKEKSLKTKDSGVGSLLPSIDKKSTKE